MRSTPVNQTSLKKPMNQWRIRMYKQGQILEAADEQVRTGRIKTVKVREVEE